MPEEIAEQNPENINMDTFLKSEFTISQTPSNYTIAGGTIKGKEWGKVDIGAGGVFNQSSVGIRCEGRYTTPFVDEQQRVAFESRTRLNATMDINNNMALNNSLNQRLAVKYTEKCDNVSFYGIAGASLDVDLDKSEVKSISPTVIVGVNFSVFDNKANIYVEGMGQNPYVPAEKKFTGDKFCVNFGVTIPI